MKFLIILTLFSASFILRADEFTPRNIVHFELENTKKISLTFDDGPSGNYLEGSTAEILNALALYNRHGIKIQSTFFVMGAKISGREDLLSRIEKENHIVANHTFHHKSLTANYYNNSTNLITELLLAHEQIFQFMPSENDLTKRWYFRAPYGSWGETRAAPLNQHYILQNYVGPIYWNVGGELKFSDGEMYSAADWACWSHHIIPYDCAIGYLNEIQRKQGGVVLLHDISKKSAELTRYLLVALTKINLFNDKKYDRVLNFFDSNYTFISLDEIPAINKYDKRALVK